jgi:crotonobetainyl-CoA:carnitine CoA-transferase CaiB-like acyl-CoA transferase
VEVTLMDAALNALLNHASAYLNTGDVPARMGNKHPSIAPYETLPTRDGHLALAVGNDGIFRRLCAVIDAPQLADDPRFRTNRDRLEHRDALADLLVEALGAATASEWVARCERAGIPAGVINGIDAAFAFAERLGLDPVVEVGGVRTLASPIRMSATPAVVRSRAPRLDEHGDALRAALRQAPRDRRTSDAA